MSTFLYRTLKSCTYVLLTMLLLMYVQSDLDQTLIRPAEWPINKRNDDDDDSKSILVALL